MPLNNELVKARLKEAFKGNTQTVIAEKLHLSQSAVSKILSGSQLPTAEQLLNIAETYNVSADWLLGRSEVKHAESSVGLSYYKAVSCFLELIRKGAIEVLKSDNGETGVASNIQIDDPIIKWLLGKGNNLRKVDYESYQTWINERLSLFKDKDIVWGDVWVEDSFEKQELRLYLSDVRNEKNLLQVYKMAKRVEESLEQIYGEDTSLFSE